MTDDELATIETRWANPSVVAAGAYNLAIDAPNRVQAADAVARLAGRDIAALVAEVRRLRKVETAARVVLTDVDAVAGDVALQDLADALRQLT